MNNTIDYSLFKISHRTSRPMFLEIVHSIIVIVNTVFYLIFGRKFFHTTYNTVGEITNILESLKNNDYDIDYEIYQVKENLPYSVINFIVYKK